MGIKKRKNGQNHTHLSKSIIFASDSLKSRANHSHPSFLKSNENDSLSCKEQHARIAHDSERVNSQPWFFRNYFSYFKEHMFCLLPCPYILYVLWQPHFNICCMRYRSDFVLAPLKIIIIIIY